MAIYFSCFDLFQSIKIDLKPNPIKILDLATIVKSPTEPEKGPSFFVEAKKDPIFFEVSDYWFILSRDLQH